MHNSKRNKEYTNEKTVVRVGVIFLRGVLERIQIQKPQDHKFEKGSEGRAM